MFHWPELSHMTPCDCEEAGKQSLAVCHAEKETSFMTHVIATATVLCYVLKK